MKKIVLILCVLTAVLACTFYLNSSAYAKNYDPKEKFVYMYFSTDLQNRFTNYLVGTVCDQPNQLNYSKDFISDFQQLTTENFFLTMLTNREPLKYDLTAFENGYKVTVRDITFVEKDPSQGLYSFKARVTEKYKTKLLTCDYSGHLNVDASGKISGFRVQKRSVL